MGKHHVHNHTSGKGDVRNPLFRDPLQLVTDIVFLIFTLVYIPLRNVIRSFMQKPKSLKGKICLVTGSGRGLGREICLGLAREGAIIACADINVDNNVITVHKLKDAGASVKGYKLNVANKQEVESVVKEVEADLGPIYLLVNNAAIIVPSKDPSEEFTRATFNVNTLGPIWMTMAVLPGMKSRNDGHIVNISSISGLYGTPILSIYAASKAALSNFSQSLRLELSFEPKNKICVTCIHPDVINTSEDYVEMLKTRISAQDVRTVSADVIHAIKYNKTDFSSPRFYYYLFALNVLFPSEVIHKFIKLMDVTATVPTQEEWEELPVAELVRSCRPPKDSEETMRLLASDRVKSSSEVKPRKISFTTTSAPASASQSHPAPSDDHLENGKDDDEPEISASETSSSETVFTIRSLRETSAEDLTNSIKSLRESSTDATPSIVLENGDISSSPITNGSEIDNLHEQHKLSSQDGLAASQPS